MVQYDEKIKNEPFSCSCENDCHRISVKETNENPNPNIQGYTCHKHCQEPCNVMRNRREMQREGRSYCCFGCEGPCVVEDGDNDGVNATSCGRVCTEPCEEERRPSNEDFPHICFYSCKEPCKGRDVQVSGDYVYFCHNDCDKPCGEDKKPSDEPDRSSGICCKECSQPCRDGRENSEGVSYPCKQDCQEPCDSDDRISNQQKSKLCLCSHVCTIPEECRDSDDIPSDQKNTKPQKPCSCSKERKGKSNEEDGDKTKKSKSREENEGKKVKSQNDCANVCKKDCRNEKTACRCGDSCSKANSDRKQKGDRDGRNGASCSNTCKKRCRDKGNCSCPTGCKNEKTGNSTNGKASRDHVSCDKGCMKLCKDEGKSKGQKPKSCLCPKGCRTEKRDEKEKGGKGAGGKEKGGAGEDNEKGSAEGDKEKGGKGGDKEKRGKGADKEKGGKEGDQGKGSKVGDKEKRDKDEEKVQGDGMEEKNGGRRPCQVCATRKDLSYEDYVAGASNDKDSGGEIQLQGFPTLNEIYGPTLDDAILNALSAWKGDAEEESGTENESAKSDQGAGDKKKSDGEDKNDKKKDTQESEKENGKKKNTKVENKDNGKKDTQRSENSNEKKNDTHATGKSKDKKKNRQEGDKNNEKKTASERDKNNKDPKDKHRSASTTETKRDPKQKKRESPEEKKNKPQKTCHEGICPHLRKKERKDKDATSSDRKLAHKNQQTGNKANEKTDKKGKSSNEDKNNKHASKSPKDGNKKKDTVSKSNSKTKTQGNGDKPDNNGETIDKTDEEKQDGEPESQFGLRDIFVPTGDEALLAALSKMWTFFANDKDEGTDKDDDGTGKGSEDTGDETEGSADKSDSRDNESDGGKSDKSGKSNYKDSKNKGEKRKKKGDDDDEDGNTKKKVKRNSCLCKHDKNNKEEENKDQIENGTNDITLTEDTVDDDDDDENDSNKKERSKSKNYGGANKKEGKYNKDMQSSSTNHEDRFESDDTRKEVASSEDDKSQNHESKAVVKRVNHDDKDRRNEDQLKEYDSETYYENFSDTETTNTDDDGSIRDQMKDDTESGYSVDEENKKITSDTQHNVSTVSDNDDSPKIKNKYYSSSLKNSEERQQFHGNDKSRNYDNIMMQEGMDVGKDAGVKTDSEMIDNYCYCEDRSVKNKGDGTENKADKKHIDSETEESTEDQLQSLCHESRDSVLRGASDVSSAKETRSRCLSRNQLSKYFPAAAGDRTIDLVQWLHDEYLSLGNDIEELSGRDMGDSRVAERFKNLKERQDRLHALSELIKTKQDLEDECGLRSSESHQLETGSSVEIADASRDQEQDRKYRPEDFVLTDSKLTQTSDSQLKDLPAWTEERKHVKLQTTADSSAISSKHEDDSVIEVTKSTVDRQTNTSPWDEESKNHHVKLQTTSSSDVSLTEVDNSMTKSMVDKQTNTSAWGEESKNHHVKLHTTSSSDVSLTEGENSMTKSMVDRQTNTSPYTGERQRHVELQTFSESSDRSTQDEDSVPEVTKSIVDRQTNTSPSTGERQHNVELQTYSESDISTQEEDSVPEVTKSMVDQQTNTSPSSSINMQSQTIGPVDIRQPSQGDLSVLKSNLKSSVKIIAEKIANIIDTSTKRTSLEDEARPSLADDSVQGSKQKRPHPRLEEDANNRLPSLLDITTAKLKNLGAQLREHLNISDRQDLEHKSLQKSKAQVARDDLRPTSETNSFNQRRTYLKPQRHENHRDTHGFLHHKANSLLRPGVKKQEEPVTVDDSSISIRNASTKNLREKRNSNMSEIPLLDTSSSGQLELKRKESEQRNSSSAIGSRSRRLFSRKSGDLHNFMYKSGLRSKRSIIFLDRSKKSNIHTGGETPVHGSSSLHAIAEESCADVQDSDYSNQICSKQNVVQKMPSSKQRYSTSKTRPMTESQMDLVCNSSICENLEISATNILPTNMTMPECVSYINREMMGNELAECLGKRFQTEVLPKNTKNSCIKSCTVNFFANRSDSNCSCDGIDTPLDEYSQRTAIFNRKYKRPPMHMLIRNHEGEFPDCRFGIVSLEQSNVKLQTLWQNDPYSQYYQSSTFFNEPDFSQLGESDPFCRESNKSQWGDGGSNEQDPVEILYPPIKDSDFSDKEKGDKPGSFSTSSSADDLSDPFIRSAETQTSEQEKEFNESLKKYSKFKHSLSDILTNPLRITISTQFPSKKSLTKRSKEELQDATLKKHKSQKGMGCGCMGKSSTELNKDKSRNERGTQEDRQNSQDLVQTRPLCTCGGMGCPRAAQRQRASESAARSSGDDNVQSADPGQKRGSVGNERRSRSSSNFKDSHLRQPRSRADGSLDSRENQPCTCLQDSKKVTAFGEHFLRHINNSGKKPIHNENIGNKYNSRGQNDTTAAKHACKCGDIGNDEIEDGEQTRKQKGYVQRKGSGQRKSKKGSVPTKSSVKINVDGSGQATIEWGVVGSEEDQDSDKDGKKGKKSKSKDGQNKNVRWGLVHVQEYNDGSTVYTFTNSVARKPMCAKSEIYMVFVVPPCKKKKKSESE